MWSLLLLIVGLVGAAGQYLAPTFEGGKDCFLWSTERPTVAGTCKPEKDCPFAKRERRAGRTPDPASCRPQVDSEAGVCCAPADRLGSFVEEKGKGCFHRAGKIPGTCTPLAQCGSAKLEVEKGLQPQPCGDRAKDDEVCCAPTELTCYSSGLSVQGQDGPSACVDHLNSLLYAPKNSSADAEKQPYSVARAKCREYSRYSCADPFWSRYKDDVNLRMIDNCRGPGTYITTYMKFYPDVNGYTYRLLGAVSPSGGKPVEHADEFPHLALLGYGNPGEVTYHCGGSLISPDFILTAAHCGSVQWVLLGSVNRSTGLDDPHISRAEFIDYPQLIEVQAVIPHPDYNPKEQYNDIALLRLKRPATMTRISRPACLHLDGEKVPEDAVAAGWGHTSDVSELPSEVLIKVNLKTKPLHDCDYAVDDRRLKRGLVEESHLCAGGEGIRDTCPGDSGGPLMVRKPDTDTYCMFNILGVVSFGPQNCGEGFPSVYTPVAPYVPWIESVVWPDEASLPRTTSAQSSAPPASGLREGLIFSESQNYASWL